MGRWCCGGDADETQLRGKARADAVVNDLVKTYGTDPARLVAQGAGITKPVASNDSEDGRAKNRRVELVKAK